MRRILRREKSSYTLGIVFCLLGLLLLAFVLWKAWPHVSASQLTLSELWSYLWTEQLSFPFGIDFKLIYFTALGVITLVFGAVIVALSQKWFILSGETVFLQCPYCKNFWRARRAKGWAECPHCRQFVQPQVARRS